MKWKLAVFADEAGDSLDEQITAMVENDISCLEIRGVDGMNISKISKEKAGEIRKRLEEKNLAVWSLGSPYGKIDIRERFEPHLSDFQYGLELAEILGTGHMRIFSFYVPQEEKEYYTDEVMERLEKFLLAAKGSGIMLCHENEKGIYGDRAKECLKIHQNFPELKGVFDPANFIQCGQDTGKAWEVLSPYVEYLHIKDALPDGTVVPAGQGAGNIPFILENYRGQVLTVEPHLSVFKGFEKLEQEKKKSAGECYFTQREAFDKAVDSLKELIE